MISLQAQQVAQIVSGKLIADEVSARKLATGFVWDSRDVECGNGFVAMPGEHVDGNEYAAAAIQAGAGAVLCTREPSAALVAIAAEFMCPLIVIDDGTRALTALARFWRRKLRAVVIGVTGSCGKTSTKDFLASVLSQRFSVCATQANRNNELGVPATVLSADLETEALVVEMGMRGSGQIRELCEFVHPSIGVVTNIGTSHLGLLGSQEAIATAKAELLAALPHTGLAVLNADDPHSPHLVRCGRIVERGVKLLSFGMRNEADVMCADVTLDASARASFSLCIAGQPAVEVTLGLAGEQNVPNALAAAAVGSYLGLSAQEIASGLAAAQGSGMRMEVLAGAGGVTIVNDAYNACPDSMRAAVRSLADMRCDGRRIAVLGDMGELGSRAPDMHRAVGRAVAECRLDMLVCVGTLGTLYREGARGAGMEASRMSCFETVQEACAFVRETVREGDVVLVKASRFMGLERIVEEVAGQDV